MSSTNRGADRQKDDLYATPMWCVERLFDHLHHDPLNYFNGDEWHWLEPCVANGSIINGVYSCGYRPRWTAVELRQTACVTPCPVEYYSPQDFLTWEAPRRFDTVITNPPFLLAQEFIDKSLTIADNVIMLLRLNYLGSKKRKEFHQRYPSDVYVLSQRPSFINGATDSCEYAWFHWHGQSRGEISVI